MNKKRCRGWQRQIFEPTWHIPLLDRSLKHAFIIVFRWQRERLCFRACADSPSWCALPNNAAATTDHRINNIRTSCKFGDGAAWHKDPEISLLRTFTVHKWMAGLRHVHIKLTIRMLGNLECIHHNATGDRFWFIYALQDLLKVAKLNQNVIMQSLRNRNVVGACSTIPKALETATVKSTTPDVVDLRGVDILKAVHRMISTHCQILNLFRTVHQFDVDMSQ